MAKDRDSDASTASQSKRRPLSQHDSDSQASDIAHQHNEQDEHHGQLHQRPKHKHVVGAPGGGRIHARVPSSKALHKHHQTASSTKLNRRQPSPTSPDITAQVAFVASHRRAASDVKLSRDSSSTNLRKNTSQSSLRRNRSHVDVAKRNKSSTQLKRSLSNPNVTKLKSSRNQVHFDLGTDGQGEEGQEDEWVDASNSASPYLSRRGSTVSSIQSSAKQPAGEEDGEAGDSYRPHSPPREGVPSSPSRVTDDRPGTSNSAQTSDPATTQHKEYLTSRLLKRIPSHGAPPKMSEDTASVRAAVVRQPSPDSGLSRESTSTLSGTPRTTSHPMPGHSGKEAMTSRFITTSSQGSGITGEGSFYTSSSRHGGSRPNSGRQNGDNESAPAPRRPRSMGALGQGHDVARSAPTQAAMRHGDTGALSDDEVEETSHAMRSGRRSRRSGGYTAAPAELSRTQQKLNLERASSTLEPSHRHHQGPVAGALLGGAGYDTRDPRVGKLLERSGMEYLVVRRYQNPVARSLARIAQLPGADKNRRIPNKSGGSAAGRGGHAKRASEYSGGRFGLSQSFRERDHRDIHSSGGGSASKRPLTPRRTFSSVQPNGAQSSAEMEEAGGRLHEGLSGSSLVDGEEDDGTVALLRNLWEKNLDLSASQD